MTPAAQPDLPATHLPKRLQAGLRVAWLVVAGLLLATFAAAVPVRLNHLLTLIGSGSASQVLGMPPDLEPTYTLRLGPSEAAALQALGLSQRFYAGYVVAFEVALALICTLVAVFIFLRRSDDWLTVWVSLILVLLGTNSVQPEINTLATVWSGWGTVYLALLAAGSAALGMVSHVHLLFLSPDGRFVPRWTLRLAAVFAGGELALALYGGAQARTWAQMSLGFVLAGAPAWAGLFVVGIWSQIYRYRHVSNAVQRQQTKWVIVGLVGFTLGFVVNSFFLWATVGQAGLPRLLYNLARAPLVSLSLMLLPIGLGFSILRYRLWDIDLIIRRTLIYSSLTAALLLVYLSSVVLLQALFQTATGQAQSEFVTVLSTLAIAALFVPLRRRAQDFIDRLFYRRKYDAAKILAAFSTTLRDETDLENLAEGLVSVVAETMQPAPISLWLKQTDRPNKP